MTFKNLIRLSFLSVLAYYAWTHFSKKEPKIVKASQKRNEFKMNSPKKLISKREVISIQETVNEEVHSNEIFPSVSLELAETESLTQFLGNTISGSMELSGNRIDSLNISLENTAFNIDLMGLDIVGNTFTYEINGEIQSGLIYQSDSNKFNITFTDGPLANLRFNFVDNNTQENNIEAEAVIVDYDDSDLSYLNESVHNDPNFKQEITIQEEIIINDENSFNFNQDS